MLKTRIRKVRPQRLAGETCWKNQKRKKIEESFASFLCTTMQSGSSVVVCFTRNTLKKDMTKPSTIEFKVSSYSKVKKFRIRSLEDPEIRKLRIQKINKSPYIQKSRFLAKILKLSRMIDQIEIVDIFLGNGMSF